MIAQTVSLQTAARVAVDQPGRTITGLVVPWERLGYTSAGPTVYAFGSVRVPADASRVKLLIQHDDGAEAVGVGVGFALDADGLTGLFHVPPGPAGDAALRAAANGLRDGLSVGTAVTSSAVDVDGTLRVSAADLVEVSLVTLPAFEDAYVRSVAANRKVPLMPPINQAAAQPVTDPPDQPDTEPVEQPDPAEPEPAEPDQSELVTASAREPQARAITPSRTVGRGMTLQQAARTTLRHLQAGKPGSMLQAALLDLVPADDVGQGLIRPQFVGELWNASSAARPVIDSIRRGRLDSLSVVGWVWDDRWQIDPYTGNKTAIPSNKVTTKAVTTTATRYAGGLDVDRVFIDLGSPGMIEDLFSQGTDSYRIATEAAAVTAILAAATSTGAHDALTDFLTVIGVEAATIGARIDWVVVASDVWSGFAGMKSADVPWWLDNGDGAVNLGSPAGSAGKVTFAVDPSLPAATMLAGDGRAATWYEVDPPIRVRAENIPNGGVDIGVFGYAALLINDASAIFKGTITPPVGAATAAPSKSAK